MAYLLAAGGVVPYFILYSQKSVSDAKSLQFLLSYIKTDTLKMTPACSVHKIMFRRVFMPVPELRLMNSSDKKNSVA
jgi:hypothetical protein